LDLILQNCYTCLPNNRSPLFGDRYFWESRDGVATHYGLDSKGTESQWSEIFYTHLDWPWGRQPLYTGYWVILRGTVDRV